MTKTQHDLIGSWLEKSRRDLLTAEYAIHAEEIFPDIICFHAQQPAEKCLKAMIIHHDRVAPRTHNLGDLVTMIAGWDPQIMEIIEDSLILTPYAIESRYPDSDMLTYEDAQEAIELSTHIRYLVLKRISR